MELVALPAFADNYIWMLCQGAQALVVDPGDAAPVREALQARGLRLTAILVTHHHADHVGGIAALLPLLQGPVWGPAREALPVPVQGLTGGEQIAWCDQPIDVIDVAGHTAGHLAYQVHAADGQAPLLFCGDALFSAGCGRVFEGSPQQLHASLQRLALLPPDTRVCCAHEYTLANLRFALAADPDNAALQAHAAWAEARRAQGLPTLPSRIATELQINPFLRCSQPALLAAARRRDASVTGPAQVFATLRAWKNEFR